MTTLNVLLGTLTGPRRLRWALRRKTAPITRLLVALDGPCQLRATIPAAVFGGDIFNVMSRQLREALIVPPATASITSRSHRKPSLPALENPLAQPSENVFPTLLTRLKPSTLSSETTSLARTTPFRTSDGASLEPQARGASITENLTRTKALDALQGLDSLGALAAARVSRMPTTEPATPSNARIASTTSALVNSLNRYWQTARETDNTTRVNEPAPATERRANVPHNFSVSDVEQPTSSAWPNAITPSAFKRGAPLDGISHNAARGSLRSAPLKPFAEPGFNFHPANDHAPQYEDLGDRLAQILHEQALQHGIDVT